MPRRAAHSVEQRRRTLEESTEKESTRSAPRCSSASRAAAAAGRPRPTGRPLSIDGTTQEALAAGAGGMTTLPLAPVVLPGSPEAAPVYVLKTA